MTTEKFLCQDDIQELKSLSPWLLIILGAIILWCLPRKLAVVITSLLRPENDGISKSHTHQEGRAIDLSVKGWTQEDIQALCDYINTTFKAIGAISETDGVSRACYYHNNGNGWHFHIQVRPIIKGVSICVS